MRKAITVMTLIALAYAVAAAQQLTNLTRVNVFAVFNSPSFGGQPIKIGRAVPSRNWARPALGRTDPASGSQRSGRVVASGVGRSGYSPQLAPDNEKIIGGRAALLISASRQMPTASSARSCQA
jgi:hypothetical protein